MKKIFLSILIILFTLIKMTAQEQHDYGICLSGGGALGYAHIGVLQALHEHGIEPKIIAGSSMGAIVGTLYAAGYTPAQMMEVCRSRKMFDTLNILHPTLSKKGFSSHKTLRRLLRKAVPYNTFDSLKYELHICVTNLGNATYKIVNSGNLQDYVIASASIPGVFEINYIDNGIYVDGGVLNNFPSEAIRNKCKVLIGVDVLPCFEKEKTKNTRDIIITTIRAMLHANSISGQQLCDHLIISPAIKDFHEFDFEKYEEIYKIGYDAAIEYIKNNPEILKYVVK